MTPMYMSYREDRLSAFYRWLGKRVERLARRMPYIASDNLDPRFRLEMWADHLVTRAIYRAWRQADQRRVSST